MDVSTDRVTALRGTLVTCRDDPFLTDPARAFAVEADGVVICRGGRVEAAGPAAKLLASVPPGSLDDYSGCLIVPGFIDTHVHYVQTAMVACYGEQLLDWLERYAFPAEIEFHDAAHAAAMAKIFCDELLRNGTTTALVFCAVYPQSVDALFAEAERRGMRLAAGKVLMDRNAPEALRDTAQRGYDDSKALIARWHGHADRHSTFPERRGRLPWGWLPASTLGWCRRCAAKRRMRNRRSQRCNSAFPRAAR